MWYPAVELGTYATAHDALASGGVTGELADFIVAGLDDAPGEFVAYRVRIDDDDESDARLQPVLVLAPHTGHRVRLFLGYSGLLADTADDAMMLAAAAMVDAAIAGAFDEPPVLTAIEWCGARGVLQ